MPKNSPEYQKEYQRLYRERKKAEKRNAQSVKDFPPAAQLMAMDSARFEAFLSSKGIVETELPTVPVENVDRPKRKKQPADEPLFPKTDREYGLPRSNYYSKHDEPGGWAETIRNIDPHLAQKILDRIAPPRKLR